jgi:TonB family protein
VDVCDFTAEPRIIPRATPAPTAQVRKPDLVKINPTFGPYDSALVKAIQKRWESLLLGKELQFGGQMGQVVVTFKLHPDGTISDVAVTKSEVNSDLTQLSVSAVKDASPFGPWSDEMRQKIKGNFRELTFKFEYK